MFKHVKSPVPGRLVLGDAEVEFLSADRASGHAAGYDLSIIDEAGLFEERDRSLFESMFTSTSGRDGRLWAIGIQATGPMFAEMRERSGEPGTVFKLFGADQLDCDVTDQQAWQQANPALGTIKSKRYMVGACNRAKLNQSLFRRLDLNQPVQEERDLLVTVQDWLKLEVPEDDLPPRIGSCVVGFDPGRNRSMTAAAVLWENGRLEVLVGLPGTPSISARQEHDRVGELYQELIDAGSLRLYGGVVTPYEDFCEDVAKHLEGEDVRAWSTDRFRRIELIEAVEDKLGLPWGTCVTRTKKRRRRSTKTSLRSAALSWLAPRRERSRYDAVSAILKAVAADRMCPPGATVCVADPEDEKYRARAA